MFHRALREAGSAGAYDEVAWMAFAGLVEAVRCVRPTLPVQALHALAHTAWAAADGAVVLSDEGLTASLLLPFGTMMAQAHAATARHLRRMVERA